MVLKKDAIKWKPVQLEGAVVSGDIEGLIGIEECTDYDITDLRSQKQILKRKIPVADLKKSKKRKKQLIVEQPVTPSKSGCTNEMVIESVIDGEISSDKDMSAWEMYSLPKPLLQALSDQNFTEPTLIQSQTLPPAILGRRNILGAAETGSGKTLAFGLPILTGILNLKKNENFKDSKRLYALILTPTRELAVQVKNHLVAIAKYTDINIAVVVGGMAAVKQERLLNKYPEIVVATPGRLWELIQLGNPHLGQVDTIKYLAIDETDRMIEKGHFQELQLLLERLNIDEDRKKQRQTFVFSATLTLVHDLPKHLITKKKIKNSKKITNMTSEQKLQKIIHSLGINNPKIIDINSTKGISGTLTECRITCPIDKKDYYVYYFLQRHPGRTLIFCNSVGCVRRLTTLLSLLECSPLPLHSSMQQRQRLKNLDKFRENDRCTLIATDVAARGLDIPSVDHVLHYQTPRTSESYVHRSGRTARAQKKGITVVLMEPAELANYLKLCKTLGKTEDLPVFPVEESYLHAVEERVNLARELDKIELKVKKATSESGWLQKAADEMDIVLEDVSLKYDVNEAHKLKKQAEVLRKQLSYLLSKPLFPKLYSGKYPLSSGSLQIPVQKEENALEVVRAALEGKSKLKVKPRPLFKPKKVTNKGKIVKNNVKGKKVK